MYIESNQILTIKYFSENSYYFGKKKHFYCRKIWQLKQIKWEVNWSNYYSIVRKCYLTSASEMSRKEN